MGQRIMQSAQRFGGAMFTPVMLLAFSGMIIGISTLFTSSQIWGSWASDQQSFAYKMWNLLAEGGWTIFNQMPLIFVVGLPIGLAKKQHARCCLEALLLYLTFHYFISTILIQWGEPLGFDMESHDIDKDPRLANVAGLQTLNMGVAGALLISGIVVWIHNRTFDTKLPAWLGAFKGSPFVCIIGFFVLIPVAAISVFVWPVIQDGIAMAGAVITSAQEAGVWGFTFLEKALLPFGLHHLIYFPVYYDNLVVDRGTYQMWLADLPDIAASTASLRELAPYSGFQMTALSSLFGIPGIAMAFYFTTKKERRKKLLAFLIPLVFTASICAITEPIEFTFLFVAPLLFVVHAFLAACLSTTVYIFGIVGSMSGNFFEQLAMNYIPLWPNHWNQYIIFILIGLAYTFIYFIVFRFLILKFDYKTPGRDDADAIKFYTKKDYKEKKGEVEISKNSDDSNSYENKILETLGGADNIEDVTNCATRLRVTVKDEKLVGSDNDFKNIGTHGAKITGKNVQVIIGLDVPNVREKFEKLLNIN